MRLLPFVFLNYLQIIFARSNELADTELEKYEFKYFST